MRNKIIITVIVSVTLFLLSASTSEAKVLPRFASGGSGASTSTGSISTKSYNGVGVAVRFLPGRYGIRVSFTNLQNAENVNYVFTYESQGEQQGIQGTLSPSDGSSTSRDLVFGTCSSGTCVSRIGVKNAKLEITSKLTSGKTSIKKYRIRV